MREREDLILFIKEIVSFQNIAVLKFINLRSVLFFCLCVSLVFTLFHAKNDLYKILQRLW